MIKISTTHLGSECGHLVKVYAHDDVYLFLVAFMHAGQVVTIFEKGNSGLSHNLYHLNSSRWFGTSSSSVTIHSRTRAAAACISIRFRFIVCVCVSVGEEKAMWFHVQQMIDSYLIICINAPNTFKPTSY